MHLVASGLGVKSTALGTQRQATDTYSAAVANTERIPKLYRKLR
jgi:hypothetical protein